MRVAGASPAMERLEDPLALGGGDAGPVVDHAHERLGGRRGDLHAHRLAPGGEYLSAFSIRFDEHALDLAGRRRGRSR